MYGYFKPYVPVAERRKKAEAAVAKAAKKGQALSPVVLGGGRSAIAKTFWGKAWCDNLEHYSDFANRLPRGRTYVRNGSVIDLKLVAGGVQAMVMGSSLYKVEIKLTLVAGAQWQALSADCAGSIDSLVELLQGRLSQGVMARICQPSRGLFPEPKEINFSCSCPDSAAMCKHVAATLYGVGARLDLQPELIFALRGVDAKDLVAQASSGLVQTKNRPSTSKRLDDTALADVFGLEMAEIETEVVVATTMPASKKKTPVAKKAPLKAKPASQNKSANKLAAVAKPAPTKKVAISNEPVAEPVRRRSTKVPKPTIPS